MYDCTVATVSILSTLTLNSFPSWVISPLTRADIEDNDNVESPSMLTNKCRLSEEVDWFCLRCWLSITCATTYPFLIFEYHSKEIGSVLHRPVTILYSLYISVSSVDNDLPVPSSLSVLNADCGVNTESTPFDHLTPNTPFSMENAMQSVDDVLSPMPHLETKDVEEEETKDLPFRLPETFYDVRVKERYNNQYTSISRISSGSKKIFFILTLVIAAEINKIPLLLLEELENSVHPRLLQNLLTAIVQLAGDTKVLITSHSPYLIKYLEPTKMKFGIPTELGVADFRSLKPNKVAKVLKNASAEEVSVGEYMFEMLLDMDCNDELINEYFK